MLTREPGSAHTRNGRWTKEGGMSDSKIEGQPDRQTANNTTSKHYNLMG